MPTNLDLDDKLIDQACRVGNHATKKEAVTAALQEYIRRRKSRELLDLFNQIDYWPDYDHKALRRKRSA